MAKNKWQKQDDADSFEEEDLEEFGELVEVEGGEIDAVVEPEPVEVEPDPEPEPEKQPEVQVSARANVTSLHAYVYPDTNVHTKPVAGVARGNMLSVLGELDDEKGDIWYHVTFTNRDGKQEGFIQKQRVQLI